MCAYASGHASNDDKHHPRHPSTLTTAVLKAPLDTTVPFRSCTARTVTAPMREGAAARCIPAADGRELRGAAPRSMEACMLCCLLRPEGRDECKREMNAHLHTDTVFTVALLAYWPASPGEPGGLEPRMRAVACRPAAVLLLLLAAAAAVEASKRSRHGLLKQPIPDELRCGKG